jgi:selenide,water dikinase
MQTPPLPLSRDLVLIGGGHAHALVLRKWGMNPLPGARLTVINPGPTAPYSGMLPGFVAGHYRRADLDIDLVQLARFAGARVVLGAVDGLDTAARLVHVAGRPPIAYDVASVNVGITSAMPDLPGFADHAVPAKPLGPFAARWEAYRDGTGPARVAVIGGGVAGAELVMAMAHALRARARPAELHLIEAGTALAVLAPKARSMILDRLRALAVTVLEQAPVAAILADRVLLADGREVACDFTTGAAGARPHGWIAATGLDLHEGFITIDETLRSSDPAVFAAGDCAHMRHAPRPKAGVFAVRQAPVLHDNLCAALAGQRLRRYRPQRDYLKLISLGGKAALAEKRGLTLSGGLMWRWKDHIDRAFMDRFRDLPAMSAPELPPLFAQGMDSALGDKPLCGGCGAKIGRGALGRALATLPGHDRDDIATLPGDDAALLRTGGATQVISTDHLRAVTADPVMMARIAAVHALGDIWAMAARPQAATATIILPRLSPDLQERTLSEIMAAASAVMQVAGAAIVGGHSSIGDELTIGFTVTGLCDGDPVTLAGGRPGDALILTKPLGSGILMAAEMAGRASGAAVAQAFAHMTRPQDAAARLLACAHAMTDVTGFGLAGHLLNLCESSGCAGEIDLDAVPLMEGAAALAASGIRSSIHAQNHALTPDLPDSGKAALLYDPQTAGGLLAAVAEPDADTLVNALRAAGYPAARIGRLTSGKPRITLT